MTAELKAIGSTKEPLIQDAREIIASALDMGFEAVVIVAVHPETGVWFRKSQNLSTLQVLGAIEFAKYEVNKAWK